MTATANGSTFEATRVSALKQDNSGVLSLTISGYTDTQSIVLTLQNFTATAPFQGGLYTIGSSNPGATQVGYGTYKTGNYLFNANDGSITFSTEADGSLKGTFTLTSPTLYISGSFITNKP